MDDERVDHSASHLTPEMLPTLSLAGSVENAVDGEVHATSAASSTHAIPDRRGGRTTGSHAPCVPFRLLSIPPHSIG